MLPPNALIIPLYVVLARYHEVNQLSGVIVTYLTFVLPFSIWTLRGFIIVLGVALRIGAGLVRVEHGLNDDGGVDVMTCQLRAQLVDAE